MPWKTFLQAHWEGLTACDLFTVEVLTLAGLQRYLVFFVIALQSRRVTIAGIHPQPYGTWMEQMARKFDGPGRGLLATRPLSDSRPRPGSCTLAQPRCHRSRGRTNTDRLPDQQRMAQAPTPPAAPAGRPGSDRFRGQPHRHIAASNEGLVIGRPVRNAVLRLIRGMDLRLHSVVWLLPKVTRSAPPPAGSFRVAPGDHSPEALTRSGLGDFHHPALPLMWLVARGPLPFEVAVT